jgi:glucose/arabinose dehydrogenase
MQRLWPVVCLAAGIGICGCFVTRPSDGGGQTSFSPPRLIDAGDIALPAGYAIELVAQGFTFPTAVVVDDEDQVYVVEAGYSYGEVFTTPRLLRVTAGGTTSEIARGDGPPWTGASFHDGAFYISAGGDPGRVLRITREGQLTTLVDNLPSKGDHHTNRPVIGPDGFVYFSVGVATNAGVVGLDNYDFGWLERHPEFHDIPGQDIVLAGQNFTTPNPLTADPNDEATTGPFLPFGTPSQAGQSIAGEVPCTGCIMRVPLEGGALELVAWGLRNPFGLAFGPDGNLYTSDNGYDQRGSRPIYGSADFLWQVTPGTWYGFPDFAGGLPLTDPFFGEAGNPQPQFLLAEHPNTPPQPITRLGVHSSSNGMAFSTSAAFGYAGELFIAQFGDMAPGVGKVLHPVGFKVVRVDVETGVINDFAVNKGRRNEPASKLKRGGLERPVDVAFSRDGSTLYILDFGVMTIGEDPEPRQETGVLWRVTRQN